MDVKTNEKDPEKFTASQIYALVMLCMNRFMFTSAISLLAPIYPKELSERGGSEIISGVIFSFYALIAFVLAPIFGKLVPKIGVKTALITGLLTSGTGNILFGTLSHIEETNLYIALSLVFRAIESIGATSFLTSSNVVISEIFPCNIGFVRGLIEIFNALGFSLGPAIGGLFYSLGGFQLPFMLIGAVVILMAPLNMFIKLPEVIREMKEESGIILKILRIPSILLTSFIIITTSLVCNFYEPTFEPHLRKYDLSVKDVGLVFLMFSGILALSGFLAGWISDKKPKYKWNVMILGLIVTIASLLVLGPSTMQSFLKESLFTILISIGVLGAAIGFALIPTYQCLAERAILSGLEDNLATQSAVSAIWVSSYTFGGMIGPVTAVLFYSKWGFAVMTDILVLLNLIVLSMVIIYRCWPNAETSVG